MRPGRRLCEPIHSCQSETILRDQTVTQRLCRFPDSGAVKPVPSDDTEMATAVPLRSTVEIQLAAVRDPTDEARDSGGDC